MVIVVKGRAVINYKSWPRLFWKDLEKGFLMAPSFLAYCSVVRWRVP